MEDYTKFKPAGTLRPDYGSDAPVEAKKPQKMKLEHPTVTIDAKDFPYLSNKEVGETCELKIKIKKTGQRMAENYEKNKENKITFDILQISEPKASNAAYTEIAEEGKKHTEMNRY